MEIPDNASTEDCPVQGCGGKVVVKMGSHGIENPTLGWKCRKCGATGKVGPKGELV
jgi:hypothetical protein